MSGPVIQMEAGQSGPSGQKKVIAIAEETPQYLLLKLCQSRHSVQQFELAPLMKNEPPEVAPASEVGFELINSICHFPGRGEKPDITIASLPHDLSQKPNSRLVRLLKASPQLPERDRIVPKEIGDP